MIMLFVTSSHFYAQNYLCKFEFSGTRFEGAQKEHTGYVTYEVAGVSASAIQASVMSTLSSLFKSPKDGITKLGDGIIQIDGYASSVYYTSSYPTDISFAMVIQIKDGKIRYNIPTIKQIYWRNVPFLGTGHADMSKPLYSLVEDENKQAFVRYFNDILSSINRNINNHNDW